MSYKLEYPYTTKEKMDFISFGNKNGLDIKKAVNKDLYALEAFEKFVDDTVIENTEEYNKEIAQIEQERLDKLSLTAADVERAIYKAKGMDFEDILEMIKDNPNVDLKALKIELKANNFYRGNPWINQIGALLGYTSDDLDYLFLNKELSGKFIEKEDNISKIETITMMKM